MKIQKINWHTDFKHITRHIDSLKQIMGREFPKIGSSLQRMYEDSQQVAKSASEIVDSLTNSVQKNVLNNINHLSDQKKILINAFTTNEEYINNTLALFLEEFYNIDCTLDKFESISSLLNTFRMNIRISNAKIRNHSSGIGSLTEEIKELTNDIRENSKSIRDEMQSIKSQIKESIGDNGKGNDSFASKLQTTFTQLFSNTDLFCDFNQDFVTMTNQISHESDTIVKDIYGIVVSMQFDDIIHQKLDHIKKSLTDIMSINISRHSEENVICEVAELCKMQVLQLETIKDELKNSINTIKKGMNGVIAMTRQMTTHTLSNKDKNGKNALDYLNEINNSISKISDGFYEIAKRDEILSETASDIAVKAGNIRKFIKNVNKIGTVIKIVSLNSQFKVKNFGVEGRRLTELSKAILELSGKTISNTEDLSLAINKISSRSDEMKKYSLNIIKKDIDKANAIIKRLHKIIIKLNKLHNNLLEKLRFIIHAGNTLIEGVTHEQSAITVHEKGTDIIENMISLFKKVTDECNTLFPNRDKQVTKETISATRSRYTMQNERDIYDKHFGSKKEAEPAREKQLIASEAEASANIEFF